MNKFLSTALVIGLALNLSIEASAQSAKRAAITCEPYVQCVSETGFTVIWSTDVESIAWVEVAPDDGTHWYNKEREVL